MVVRLAGGIVAGRGLRVWASTPGGVCVDAAVADLPAGTPVAVGPDGGDAERAVAELRSLVAAAGTVGAGAGADLGEGFRSARLDGVRGDRRDAVLAVLRAYGLDGADRLGDRAATLVALFGAAVTKPVGVAARDAIHDGRWAALQLASAASDVLGPEQLHRLLRQESPVAFEGAASTVAGHLGQVLATVSRPRRLDLLLDLWHQVGAHQAAGARRERLIASQRDRDRLDSLRQRYLRFDDELLLRQVRATVGHEPTVAEAARWTPSPWYQVTWLGRAMQDAAAATVLLRAAVAVSDHGVAEGLARCRAALHAVASSFSSREAGEAARLVPGLSGVPARPGCYVRDLLTRLRPARIDDPTTQEYVAQRIVRARDYGIVVLDGVSELLNSLEHGVAPEGGPVRAWADSDLRDWRAGAGYTAGRPPTTWHQPPLFGGPPLAARLRGRSPADVETAADLLWYAELADALAQVNGHDIARVGYGDWLPYFVLDPPPADPEPYRPRLDSVSLAVAGAAQLVSLGGQVPRRCRTWTELVDGLIASAAIAEALTGSFRVPSRLSTLDGMTIPGTGLRFELARGPRTLAEWSEYMGNCIASQEYIDDASTGRCGLGALRDEAGIIVANVELRPARRGWRVEGFRTRFNDEPEPELAERVREWVATIAAPAPAAAPRPTRPTRARGGRPGRGRPVGRTMVSLGDELARLTERTLAAPATGHAAEVLASFLALRRASPARLTQACRDVIAADGSRLPELWAASAVRPLARAIDGLDPAQRERVEPLRDDVPLPGSLRRLARRPYVAAARSMDLVALRIRRAVGRLARDDDPALAQAIVRYAYPDMLCVLVLTVTAAGDGELTAVAPPRAVTVPGFPATRLDDDTGPWRRAWPDARELGATPEAFWTRVSSDGLLAPAAWLGAGGWPALWNRAAR